jgi:uroporphyrinogen-III synthase
MSASSLAGRGILVTRPTARAGHLARLIAAAGGEPVLFPTLEILSINNNIRFYTDIDNNNVIKPYLPDMLIFISPTAVEQGFEAVAAVLQGEPIPALAAVGAATARALQRLAGVRVLAPQGGADSESLAALPALQASAIGGKRIVIVRGEGGRDWLRDTLQARGARVEYLQCYRRVRPEGSVVPLLARWRSGGIAAVTVHSREALDNLMAMLPPEAHDLVCATPLFAAHARIAEHAFVRGMQHVLTTGPGDEAMVEGLQSFFVKVT